MTGTTTMTRAIHPGAYDARSPVPGTTASALWLAARRLRPPGTERWKVTIALDIVDPRVAPAATMLGTRLHIMIDKLEWGVMVFHPRRGSSWIRVVNVPRVHDRDDLGLLPHVTELRHLGRLVQSIERRFQIQFRRPHAEITTDLIAAHQAILLWVVSAL